MAGIYENVAVGDVDTFGAITVERDEIVGFARRYDPQPFHLEDEAAAAGPFGVLAASGWMTAALTMRMIVDRWSELGMSTLGGAGVEDLRWLRPVVAGDRLQVRRTIVAKRRSRSKPHIGIVTQRIETLDADGTAVMVMTTTSFHPAEDPADND